MIDLKAALQIAGATAGAGLVLLAGTTADARPPRPTQASCKCSCMTGPNGIYEMTYAAVASCGAYQGKTCNVEVSPGIIRSGTLTLCSAGAQSGPAAALAGTRLSADPGKPQRPARHRVDVAPRPSIAGPQR